LREEGPAAADDWTDAERGTLSAVSDPEKRSKEELDQEWGELVEEHRLAMPGIQVLFAFLLILPFQNRFRDLTTNQEYVFFAALVCAALASCC
jgi:hypothetical protein